MTAAQAPGDELSGFGKALVEYSGAVVQFAALPVDQKSDAMHQALDAMAAAVAVLPLSQNFAPAQIAANLKTLSANFQATPAFTPAQMRIARDLFDRTQSLLALVARQNYASTPSITDAVNIVKTQYEAIDTSQSLDKQLSIALACLASIELVFRAMALAATEAAWTHPRFSTPR